MCIPELRPDNPLLQPRPKRRTELPPEVAPKTEPEVAPKTEPERPPKQPYIRKKQVPPPYIRKKQVPPPYIRKNTLPPELPPKVGPKPKPKRPPRPRPKPPLKLPPKPPRLRPPKVFPKKRRRKRLRKGRLRLPPIQPWDQIHFKNTNLLNRFISEKGKILSRKVTKLTFKQQRLISIAIKQARILSLLPFVSNYKIFEKIKPTILRSARFRNKKKKFDPKRKKRSFFRKKEVL